jgi:hypothetical protein
MVWSWYAPFLAKKSADGMTFTLCAGDKAQIDATMAMRKNGKNGTALATL